MAPYNVSATSVLTTDVGTVIPPSIPALGPGPASKAELEQWATGVVEKLRSAVAGGLRFMPRLDNYTEETQSIRNQYRVMLRDPVLRASHKGKVDAVAQLPWNVRAASDDPRHKEQAAFIRHAVRWIKGGKAKVARTVLRPGLVDGFSVSEKVWVKETSGQFRGKWRWWALKGKDSKTLTLGVDPYLNVTSVRPLAFGKPGQAEDPEDFVIYVHDALFESPIGTSDHRSVFGSFWFKDTVKKLWALHLDKMTSPLIKGTYSNTDQKAALEAALEKARSHTWLTIPMGAAVEAMAIATRGEQEMENACRYNDEQMLIGTQGAYLHVIEGRIPDGRGDTSIQRDQAAIFQWGLADDLQTVINEQMVRELIDTNYWGVDDYPTVTLGNISDAEMRASLEVDRGLKELGFRHSRKGTAERYAREEATDPSDILGEAAPATVKPGQPVPAKPAGDDAPGPDGKPSEAVGGVPDLRATVGGSQAVAALQRDYYSGTLPRDAVINNAVIVFGFTQREAERLFPERPPDPPKPPGGDDITGALPFDERGKQKRRHPFAERPRRHCDSGENEGKPGPCPSGQKKEKKSVKDMNHIELREEAKSAAQRADQYVAQTVESAKSAVAKLEELRNAYPDDPSIARAHEMMKEVAAGDTSKLAFAANNTRHLTALAVQNTPAGKQAAQAVSAVATVETRYNQARAGFDRADRLEAKADKVDPEKQQEREKQQAQKKEKASAAKKRKESQKKRTEAASSAYDLVGSDSLDELSQTHPDQVAAAEDAVRAFYRDPSPENARGASDALRRLAADASVSGANRGAVSEVRTQAARTRAAAVYSERRSRVYCQEGTNAGLPGPCPTGQAGAPGTGTENPEATQSKLEAVETASKSIPARIKAKAKAFVQKTYSKLEAKYGKKGAIAVMSGIAVLTPVPIPGTSLIPIAIAEGVRLLARLFSRGSSAPAQAAEYDESSLAAELREMLEQWYRIHGKPAPDFTDEQLAAAIQSGLEHGGKHFATVQSGQPRKHCQTGSNAGMPGPCPGPEGGSDTHESRRHFLNPQKQRAAGSQEKANDLAHFDALPGDTVKVAGDVYGREYKPLGEGKWAMKVGDRVEIVHETQVRDQFQGQIPGYDKARSPAWQQRIERRQAATQELRDNFPTDTAAAKSAMVIPPTLLDEAPELASQLKPAGNLADTGGQVVVPASPEAAKAIKAKAKELGYSASELGTLANNADALWETVQSPAEDVKLGPNQTVQVKPINDSLSIVATETGFKIQPTADIRAKAAKEEMRVAARKQAREQPSE